MVVVVAVADFALEMVVVVVAVADFAMEVVVVGVVAAAEMVLY